jgi:hypothetical protein
MAVKVSLAAFKELFLCSGGVTIVLIVVKWLHHAILADLGQQGISLLFLWLHIFQPIVGQSKELRPFWGRGGCSCV